MDDILSERNYAGLGACDTHGPTAHATYLNRRCTGRFPGSGEAQVVRVPTGGA